MARVALGTGELYEWAWPDKALESFHRQRSNIFEVSVLFERAHAHEPAHIHSTALACCTQCTSCEAIVCARSMMMISRPTAKADCSSPIAPETREGRNDGGWWGPNDGDV